MNTIDILTQATLDALPIDYNGRICIKFGTRMAPAIVTKRYRFPVEACENSSVEAWENSSVVARGNSSTNAKGNSQITDRTRSHDIKIAGNARVIHDPSTAMEYIEEYELPHDAEKRTAHFFKAVHKIDGKYFASHDPSFEYKIGEVAVADCLTENPTEDCGHGIHMAYKEWALSFGRAWPDLAILELEANTDGLVVPINGAGKVRAASAKVIREVPLEECGLLGKMILKKRNDGGTK